jgi:hypothetical protein
MLYKIKKGQASYGEAIGILLLDSSLQPFIPGDVANATTYSFPVRFQLVKGLTGEKLLNKDTSLLDSLIEAGRELVGNGVRAITGDCGFMAVYQKEAAKQLKVPVFLSSLLQLPFLTTILGEGQKIGIITCSSETLDNALLREVGVRDLDSIYVKGMQDKEYYRKVFIEEAVSDWFDSEKVERELVSTAKEMLKEDPSVRLILLESSVFPPYGVAIQKAVDLPVFDFVTMINYVYSAVIKKKYNGYM